MRAILEQRLQALQSERESGQKMLADLDARRMSLTETLLRIEGAIAVLRELLAAQSPEPSPPGGSGGGTSAS